MDPNGPITKAKQTAINAWQEKEDLAKYLLTQKLLDVTFMKHCAKENITAVWTVITQEFSQKSILLHVNYLLNFNYFRCYTTG